MQRLTYCNSTTEDVDEFRDFAAKNIASTIGGAAVTCETASRYREFFGSAIVALF